MDGLVAIKKKLYCTVCIDAKLQDKSSVWTSTGVDAPNLAVRKAKKKLADKIEKHFSSQTHLKSIGVLKLREKNTMKKLSGKRKNIMHHPLGGCSQSLIILQ